MKKIVIFGDSITAGWLNNAVTAILKRKIEERLSQKDAYDIILQGIPGQDTNDALQHLEKTAQLGADRTFVFFGANDAATYHDITPEKFEENLHTFVKKFGSAKVAFITPPRHNDAVENTTRNNALVEKYREKTLAVASAYQAPCIDFYTQMQKREEKEQLLASDGLHLSEAGYDLLAELLCERIEEM